MQEPKSQILDFIKNELEKAKFTTTVKESRVEGSDFIITSPMGKQINLHLQSINLDKEKNIKILKSDLGEITENKHLGLVLVIENEPRILYLIPAETLLKPDNRIFFENNVSIMPHLSNWEIKIFTSAIPELAKFEISDFYLT